MFQFVENQELNYLRPHLRLLRQRGCPALEHGDRWLRPVARVDLHHLARPVDLRDDAGVLRWFEKVVLFPKCAVCSRSVPPCTS